MSNATLEYFEEYRQKIAEADRLYKRERELRREAEQIQQHRCVLLQRELHPTSLLALAF